MKSRTWQDWTLLSFLMDSFGILSELTGLRSGIHLKLEVTTLIDLCFLGVFFYLYMFFIGHCCSYFFLLLIPRYSTDKPPGPIRNSQFLKDNGQPRVGMKRGNLF